MLGWSYRKSIKPVVNKGLPQFRFATLVHDTSLDQPNHLICTSNLASIPEDLINLGLHDTRTMLRQDRATSWEEIKLFLRKLCHRAGVSAIKFKEQCQAIDISVDGVQESKKGMGTFLAISARLGGQIYLWFIYNPLQSNDLAKPSASEVLLYAMDFSTFPCYFHTSFPAQPFPSLKQIQRQGSDL